MKIDYTKHTFLHVYGPIIAPPKLFVCGMQVMVTSTSLEHAGDRESGELCADIALPGVRDIILAKTFVTFSKLVLQIIQICVYVHLSLSLSLPLPHSWFCVVCCWFRARSGEGLFSHYQSRLGQ